MAKYQLKKLGFWDMFTAAGFIFFCIYSAMLKYDIHVLKTHQGDSVLAGFCSAYESRDSKKTVELDGVKIDVLVSCKPRE